MITTTTFAAAVTGICLHVWSDAPMYAGKQSRPVGAAPVLLGFTVINNSTDVSARERRHL